MKSLSPTKFVWAKQTMKPTQEGDTIAPNAAPGRGARRMQRAAGRCGWWQRSRTPSAERAHRSARTRAQPCAHAHARARTRARTHTREHAHSRARTRARTHTRMHVQCTIHGLCVQR
eukprot:gene19632-biopygen983